IEEPASARPGDEAEPDQLRQAEAQGLPRFPRKEILIQHRSGDWRFMKNQSPVKVKRLHLASVLLFHFPQIVVKTFLDLFPMRLEPLLLIDHHASGVEQRADHHARNRPRRLTPPPLPVALQRLNGPVKLRSPPFVDFPQAFEKPNPFAEAGPVSVKN